MSHGLLPGLIAALCLAVATSRAAGGQVVVVSPDGPAPSVVTIDDPDASYAAKDLCDYLSRVTGRSIAVADTPAEWGVVIHVGADDFVRRHVPDLETLRGDGFVMRCVEADDSYHLVLAGRLPFAAQWAVEQFLHDYCGVRWIMPHPEHGEVVPSIPVVRVEADLSVRSEPDYLSRSNVGMYYYNPGGRFLRLRAHGYAFGDHAIQWMFTGDDFTAHPEWFAFFDGKRQWWSYGNGWQICTSNPQTVEHAAEYIAKYFDERPDSPIVSIGANDGSGWCECDACLAFARSVSPPYSISERWFDWVNRVAARVRPRYPDKMIESLAYSETSQPPRFDLETNVAVTKTIVLDSELDQAEDWRRRAKSVNLYSYMYGRSFLGFRHYPTAARDFLKWGHDRLGAIAHVTEGQGDWSFDGPKFHYLQALQWDVEADPDAIMREYCDASYGPAAGPMLDFWNRLEEIYERRPPAPHGRKNRRLLFYQWVSWSVGNGLPDDELLEYEQSDVTYLDDCFDRAALQMADADVHQRFRLDRVQDAWRYFRTIVTSHLATREPPSPSDSIDRARELAGLAVERDRLFRALCAHPLVNPRLGRDLNYYWAYSDGMTVFAREQTYADLLCRRHTQELLGSGGRTAAEAFWNGIEANDPLYVAAQTQLHLLRHGARPNLLQNAGFEGEMSGEWTVSGGSSAISTERAHGGVRSVTLEGQGVKLEQSVAVTPMERYGMSVRLKLLSDVPDGAAPAGARVEFFYNDRSLYELPANMMVLPSRAPAEGWTPLAITATAPPHANRAEVSVFMHYPGQLAVDDVRLESILPSRVEQADRLDEEFDGEKLAPERWTHQPEVPGRIPPRVEDGWLVYDEDDAYSITSVAAFPGLLSGEGGGRYRLRLHAAPLQPAQADAMMAFALGNERAPFTRVMTYHYFSSSQGAPPRVSVFCDKQGASTFTSTWPLTQPGDTHEVWYTFLFSPDTIEVYAAADGYDQSDAAHVASIEHGIDDFDPDGPPVLQLFRGRYRIDQVLLERIDGSAPPPAAGDHHRRRDPSAHDRPPEPLPPANQP